MMNKKGSSDLYIWTASRLIIPTIVFLALLFFISTELDAGPHSVLSNLEELKLTANLMYGTQPPFYAVIPNEAAEVTASRYFLTTKLKRLGTESSEKINILSTRKLPLIYSGFVKDFTGSTDKDIIFERTGDSIYLKDEFTIIPDNEAYCSGTQDPGTYNFIIFNPTYKDHDALSELKQLFENSALTQRPLLTHDKSKLNQKKVILMLTCSRDEEEEFSISTPKLKDGVCHLRELLDKKQTSISQHTSIPHFDSIHIRYNCDKPVDTVLLFSFIKEYHKENT